MATGNVTISFTLSGLASGGRKFSPEPNDVTAAVLAAAVVDLANGNNTITVPAGATGVLIVPPAANVNNLVLKGVNADTGVPIHSSQWSYVAIRPGTVNFVINSTGATAGVELNWI